MISLKGNRTYKNLLTLNVEELKGELALTRLSIRIDEITGKLVRASSTQNKRYLLERALREKNSCVKV